MKRWLATAAGLTLAGSAEAQVPQSNNAGYLVIRVKVAGGDDGTAPGTDGPGRPPMGGPMFPGAAPMFPGGGLQPPRPGGIPGAPMPGGGPGPMFPGGMPMPGGMPGSSGAVSRDERSVFALVPVKSVALGVVYAGKPLNRNTNPSSYWANHEYGRSLLFDDRVNVQIYSIKDTVEREIKKRHTEWAKDRKLDGLLDIISYALSTDHVELALAYASEFEKAYDPKRDAPPRIAQFAKAIVEMRPKFEEALVTPPEAEEWRKRLKANGIADDKHYALIHFGEQSVGAETINRRLTQLERNFKAFYLWHAVQGKTLKFPQKRLVVVLANRSTDVEELRPKLDGTPILSDSFYSPAHNIVVLSPLRLDEAGKSFAEIAKAKYQDGWNREELLKGKSPLVKDGDFSELFRTMTYALVDRALEEEASEAAITREGSRQLYSTLEILPKHVILPKWIDNGIGNLLHKPKNAGVVKTAAGKNATAVGILAGYGAANFVLLREWRDLWAKKELSSPPKDILLNVLTDRYFDAVRTGIDIDPPPATTAPGGNGGFGMPPGGIVPPGGKMGALLDPFRMKGAEAQVPRPGGPGPGGPGRPPGPGGPMFPGGPMGPGGFGPGGFGPGGSLDSAPDKAMVRAKLESKAQVTSWALMYYLAKTNTPALHRFFAELDKLPRDMRIDSKVIVELFARSFNMMNADLSAIDENAFKTFATDWIAFTNAIAPSWRDIELRSSSEDPGQGGLGGIGGGPPGPGN